MATEKLYDLAYRYKDTKLWKRVSDTELFAVKLADGEIGYCSVMGETGDHIALGLYPGERGYQSYRRILTTDFSKAGKSGGNNVIFSMDCLQCAFENRDMLSAEETAEVRKYAASRHRSLRGAHAFAQFDKYVPGRVKWHLETDQDVWRMCRALEAAVALDGMLKQQSKEELGLRPLQENTERIPLLIFRQGGWQIRQTPLPPAEPVWPEPLFPDDLKAARIRKTKKSGIWESGICYCSYPVLDEEDPDAIPCIPLMLVTTVPLTREMVQPVLSRTGDAEELLEGFAAVLLEGDPPPKRIRCGDDRTYALVKDLCAKAGIELTREKTEDLHEAMEALTQEMGRPDEEILDDDPDRYQEEMDNIAELFAEFSDSEMMALPPEMRKMMLDMADEGALPPSLAWRIYRLFGQ